MTNTGKTTEAWVYAFSNGAVTAQQTSESNTVQTTGTDPYTGDDVSTPVQNLGDVALSNPPARDWFEAASNFAAAMGDKVSGGVTKRIRQGLGYDDVVNYNSRAYQAGAIAGEVVNVGVQNLTPCRFVGVMRNGVRAIQGLGFHIWKFYPSSLSATWHSGI